MAKRIVIALGGNALGDNPKDQIEKIEHAAPHLVGLIKKGYEIIVTHGNGPQVGMINLAFSESSKSVKTVPRIDLPECSAMSQGYIGYHLQQGIKKELRKQKMPWHVATMVTQVEVSENDPAFSSPTKPIGPFYSKDEVLKLSHEYPLKTFREDSGRGYREIVASPMPKKIVERDSILNLLDNEFIVIACGGGGVPVVSEGDGIYRGINAVIDKDFASALLAEEVDADYLFILTAVPKVCINFGKENQKELSSLSADEALLLSEKGEFGEGSMKPKVLAASHFAKSKHGRTSVIASLSDAEFALDGDGGTKITS